MLRLTLAVTMLTFIGTSLAQDETNLHHDHSASHINAPASVMGAHLHPAGDWMFSYSYMNMEMEGNLNGSDSVTNQEIFSAGFMVAPTRMTMEMHMFGVMYGISDKLNLMLMLPYVRNEMDHVTMMNMRFTTESEGFGDTKLTGQYQAYSNKATQLILNAGVSLPTGSIDERDDTPAMANAKLPYSMQLGSGTYDLLLGATYTATSDSWFWGLQGNATIRTGSNDNQYTLGDRMQFIAWAGKSINDHHLSLSLRYDDWDNIDGADPQLNPNMVPTADPNRRAGTLTQLALGYEFATNSGALKNNRFAIEYRIPVQQDLDGPQLETNQTLSLNWHYTP